MLTFRGFFQVTCITHDKTHYWLSAVTKKMSQVANLNFRQSLRTAKFHVLLFGIVLKMWQSNGHLTLAGTGYFASFLGTGRDVTTPPNLAPN